MSWIHRLVAGTLAASAVTLGPAMAGMSFSVAHADVWQDRAPRARLHPNEVSWPMSAATFVAHSSLIWAHDGGCNDKVHASRGNINSTTLGDGGYKDRQKESLANGCDDKGSTYDSNDDAAPWDSGGPGDDAEGFFLDLDNSYRDGDGFAGTEPVYYRASSGNWVEYWFHYGKSNIVHLAGYAHEGDWEHIAIRMSDSNVPQEVEYSYHHYKCTLPWSDAPKVNGHPVVWIANQAHGSYPAGADAPWYDDISGDGKLWVAASNLDRLADQAWYPYGGAWGEVGTANDTTGPQGPHPTRGAPAFTAARCDMS